MSRTRTITLTETGCPVPTVIVTYSVSGSEFSVDRTSSPGTTGGLWTSYSLYTPVGSDLDWISFWVESSRWGVDRRSVLLFFIYK